MQTPAKFRNVSEYSVIAVTTVNKLIIIWFF